MRRSPTHLRETPAPLPDSNNDPERTPSRRGRWTAERVLLVCLLGIGLLGLVMTYGSRVSAHQSNAAAKATGAENQSGEATGKLQRDRMILHLNQRSRERAQQPDLEISQL